MGAFATAGIVLTAASLVFVVLLMARRVVDAQAQTRRVAVRAALRPAVLAIVNGDLTAPLPLRSRAESELFVDLLIAHAHLLRGPARERVATFFEGHGDLDREVTSLGSRRSQRRAAAAYRLGDMGSSANVPTLLALLEQDSDRDVRAACARSLGRLGATEAVSALVAALVERRVPDSVAAQALLAIGPAAVPELLALLESEDTHVRAHAVELVGLLGDASHAVEVIRSLRDTSAEVRGRAARALGRLGASAAAAGLRAALDDRVPAVRGDAAFALGRLRDSEAVTLLVRVAREDSFAPARAAADALVRIDPRRLAAEAMLPGAGDHLHEAASRPAA
jgi:HEAT repeat protein